MVPPQDIRVCALYANAYYVVYQKNIAPDVANVQKKIENKNNVNKLKMK